MGIPNSQLETWSHQGAITTSSLTYNSIKSCLEQYDFPDNVRYNSYLQGSYRNSTNIYANSDVDVVVELESSWKPVTSKLSEEEKSIFDKKYLNATYGWSDFRQDVLQSLKDYYDNSKIVEGNKAVKLEGYSGRLNADILVAIKYRYFFHVYENRSDSYVEGIAFYARNDSKWMYSYPKQHYNNGVTKMSNTNNNYKSLIRIYKNIKVNLVNNADIPDRYISSYYIESLLYNLPNNIFSGLYSDMLYKSLKWFEENSIDDFKCQHDLFNLFGIDYDQWSITEAKAFIGSVIEFWNQW